MKYLVTGGAGFVSYENLIRIIEIAEKVIDN